MLEGKRKANGNMEDCQEKKKKKQEEKYSERLPKKC